MGSAGVAKCFAKHEALATPGPAKVAKEPLGAHGPRMAALGQPKVSQNTRILATPTAAKVAKGPVETNGRAGAAKSFAKHEAFGHPSAGQGG